MCDRGLHRVEPALPTLALSGQYAAATTDAQRSTILFAGPSVLTSKNPGSIGQNLAFVFFHVAGLIVSMVMLRTGIFSKRTAYSGMLFNGFGLGFPVGIALSPGSLRNLRRR